MPLRYAAELLGLGGDDERAIRLLIALMVLCCDPLAIALTAAVSARRSGSQQSPEQHGRRVCGRQHGLRLDPSLEFLVQPLDRVGGACALPLA